MDSVQQWLIDTPSPQFLHTTSTVSFLQAFTGDLHTQSTSIFLPQRHITPITPLLALEPQVAYLRRSLTVYHPRRSHSRICGHALCRTPTTGSSTGLAQGGAPAANQFSKLLKLLINKPWESTSEADMKSFGDTPTRLTIVRRMSYVSVTLGYEAYCSPGRCGKGTIRSMREAGCGKGQ